MASRTARAARARAAASSWTARSVANRHAPRYSRGVKCPRIPWGRAALEDWACELCGRGALEHLQDLDREPRPVAIGAIAAELERLGVFRGSELGRFLEGRANDRSEDALGAARAAPRAEPDPSRREPSFPAGSLFHDPGPRLEEPEAHGGRRRRRRRRR